MYLYGGTFDYHQVQVYEATPPHFRASMMGPFCQEDTGASTILFEIYWVYSNTMVSVNGSSKQQHICKTLFSHTKQQHPQPVQ